MAGSPPIVAPSAPRAASGCLFHRVFQSIVNAMPSNSSASERADTKRGDRAAQVVVFAPARLHLGFLDLNGGVRRRFGGPGLTICGLGARPRMAPAPAAAPGGTGAATARRYLHQAAAALQVTFVLRIDTV